MDETSVKAARIITDWEYQAMERDPRDPMRRQIMEEAAILRAVLTDKEQIAAVRDEAIRCANMRRDRLDDLESKLVTLRAGLLWLRGNVRRFKVAAPRAKINELLDVVSFLNGGDQ